MKTRPYWMMAGGVFAAEDCKALVDLADERGWRKGTYSDGRPRGGVLVRFLTAEDGDVATAWIEGFQRLAPLFAHAFDLEIYPDALDSIQVSRWSKGDGYGMHVDHDVRNILPLDRKLSLYVSLSPGGGLEVDSLGLVRCDVGDTLAFPAIVNHAAPKQEAGKRFSVVAWVPGPNWR